MTLLPWHLTDRLVGGLNVTLPSDTIEVSAELGSTDQLWRDLVSLYAPLRDEVANTDGIPVVLTGNCVASLGVIAGIQHRGIAAALGWFDAHGDFHTEATTRSGFLGGLPLAKAVGRGDLTLPSALGMSALPEEWVILSNGRDLDPAELDARRLITRAKGRGPGPRSVRPTRTASDHSRGPGCHRPGAAARAALPSAWRPCARHGGAGRPRRRGNSSGGRARHRGDLAAGHS